MTRLTQKEIVKSETMRGIVLKLTSRSGYGIMSDRLSLLIGLAKGVLKKSKRGVTPRQISRWRLGEAIPSRENQIALVKIYRQHIRLYGALDK